MKIILFFSIIFIFSKLGVTQEISIVNKDKLYGIKYKDTLYLKIEFDEIYEEKEYKSDFHIRKGKLFGLYNVRSKSYISPLSKKPLKYAGIANFESYYYDSYYTYVDEKGKKMFINSNGKFILNCNPETLFINKEGNFYYLFGLDSLESKSKPIKALNTQFLYLDKTTLKSTFIAQNLDKKFGLINCIGETLLPFEYSSIDFFQYDGDGNHFILLGQNGKKVLYDYTYKKLVPFYFDDILKVNNSDYTNLYITLLDGKYGLFCTNEFDVFPNEFEKIYYVNEGNYSYKKNFVGIKDSKYYTLTLTDSFLNEKDGPFELIEYDLVYENFGLKKNEENYDFYLLDDHSFIKSMKISDFEKK